MSSLLRLGTLNGASARSRPACKTIQAHRNSARLRIVNSRRLASATPDKPVKETSDWLDVDKWIKTARRWQSQSAQLGKDGADQLTEVKAKAVESTTKAGQKLSQQTKVALETAERLVPFSMAPGIALGERLWHASGKWRTHWRKRSTYGKIFRLGMCAVGVLAVLYEGPLPLAEFLKGERPSTQASFLLPLAGLFLVWPVQTGAALFIYVHALTHQATKPEDHTLQRFRRAMARVTGQSEGLAVLPKEHNNDADVALPSKKQSEPKARSKLGQHS